MVEAARSEFVAAEFLLIKLEIDRNEPVAVAVAAESGVSMKVKGIQIRCDSTSKPLKGIP